MRIELLKPAVCAPLPGELPFERRSGRIFPVVFRHHPDDPFEFVSGGGAVIQSEVGLAQRTDLDLNSVAYFNGRYVPLSEATVNIATQAFQYGTNGFEGICAFWNEVEGRPYVFRLEEHYKRFLETAKFMGLSPGRSIRELSDITCEVLRRNSPTCDMYIRPNVYAAGFGAGPTLLDTVGENPSGLSVFARPIRTRPDINKGISVTISDWKKPDNDELPAWAKIGGHYVMSSKVKRDATVAGFGDALFFNTNGNLAEATTTNVFVLKDGKLYTPPQEDSILVGITRDTMMTLAREELELRS